MSSMRRPLSIRSMTGFSRVSFGGHGVELDIEARSVNHRFLDVVVKAPRCYSAYEREIKASLQKLHKRGRIEVSIVRRSVAESSAEVDVLPASLDRYVRLYGAACRKYGVSTDTIGSFIGQLILREGGEEGISVTAEEVAPLLRLVDEASEALSVIREAEGSALAGDISNRLDLLQGYHSTISSASGAAGARLRDRLLERVRLLAPDIQVDQQRLVTEVALLSDRIDISEELSRLEIHLNTFRVALQGDADGVGRRMDFLTQEIGRELNTIGSKAQDAAIQGIVVSAKAELERIREQVQNIE